MAYPVDVIIMDKEFNLLWNSNQAISNMALNKSTYV